MRNTLKRLLTIAITLTLGAAAAQPEAFGNWQGSIGPGSLNLEIFLVIEGDEAAPVATLDIPVQGLHGFPLSDVSVSGNDVGFRMDGIPGNPAFEGQVEGDTMGGVFTQGGQQFPYFLERTPEGPAELSRPQTPVLPYPYGELEVSFDSLDEGITLGGTLTLPEGDGPHTALVFITGSGAQDRDESLFGHQPFLVIADHLTRAGYATLRVDDRGVGDSTGSDADSTLQQFILDTLAAVQLLAERDDIGHIGLIGHSQGGLIAPEAANMSDDVSFVISLAGPGIRGFELLEEQNRRLIASQSAVMGVTDEALIEAAIESQLDLLSAIRSYLVFGDEGARAYLRSVIQAGYAELPPAQQPEPEQLAGMIEAEVEALLSPSMVSFMMYDPQPQLRQLEVPYLGLLFGLDVQVPADQSEPLLLADLETGGNADHTVVVLDGLNHLMQPALTGDPSEYVQIETTVDEEVLALLTRWLDERY